MMEQTLAERLLERFTPGELATVRAALARIEARAKATLAAPPKSSEPEKVIALEPGDAWGDWLTDLLHIRMFEGRRVTANRVSDWMTLGDSDNSRIIRLTDYEGDARAAALGYSVRRTAKVEPTRAGRDAFVLEVRK